MNRRYFAYTVTVAALVFAPALLSACAPVRVHSFTERGTPFAAVRTYRWADDGARATGDPRLDSNPFFERRLMSATNRELAARGFELTTSDSADLILHYHASVSQALDTATIDRMVGYCRDCESSSIYDAGTILLDLVDPKTNTLVWRAWAEGSIDGMVDNQQWLEEHIDQAVARIIATLPRRS